MRKAVKLAAMSTIAAVAIVGGSATAASAHDNGEGDQPGVNVCGNDGSNSLAEADRLGESEIDDVDGNQNFENVICQNGEENFVVIVNESERYDGLVAEALEILPPVELEDL